MPTPVFVVWSQAYENATAVIPISSGSRARQNRPPFSETKSAGLRGEQQQVGILGVDRDRGARGQPAAGLAPRQARVVGEDERRAAVDDRRDPRARLVGRDQQRQRDAGRPGGRRFVVDELGLAGLEIDEDAAERRRHEGLHQRAMIVETNRLATRPASCASAPRWRATA